MPAPTIATLYDYETIYESALSSYISNVNAIWQVLTPRTVANNFANTDFLRTPRITIEFALTSTGIQKEIQNTVEYYADREGLFTVQAVSARNDPNQNHGLLRGALRQAMTERAQAFNANTVPYYQTVDVTEGSSTQSFDRENEEILTNMTFAVKFFIPPSSFP